MTADLSRRERQILDILYRKGKATAAEVREELPGAPSYSAVRALLRILEEKGHAVHDEDGPRYVYLPARPREAARRSALDNLIHTYFEGSKEAVVEALLEEPSGKLSDDEYRRLKALIEQARRNTK
jgi:predicted transcriptional regulator